MHMSENYSAENESSNHQGCSDGDEVHLEMEFDRQGGHKKCLLIQYLSE